MEGALVERSRSPRAFEAWTAEGSQVWQGAPAGHESACHAVL